MKINITQPLKVLHIYERYLVLGLHHHFSFIPIFRRCLFYPTTKRAAIVFTDFLLSFISYHQTEPMARALLDRTSIFSALSASFKDEISKLMSPFEAPAGHIFTKEGEEITKFIIVESGYLVRTKASADGEGEPFVLDTIGEAGVTGFMHVAARDSGVAYATITAGDEGAKVWTVGIEFDQLLRYVAGDP